MALRKKPIDVEFEKAVSLAFCKINVFQEISKRQ